MKTKFEGMLPVGAKVLVEDWYFRHYCGGRNIPLEVVGYAEGCLGRNYRVRHASGEVSLLCEFHAVEAGL